MHWYVVWLYIMGLYVEIMTIDVDECDGSSICQQVCINTPGSFTCGCQEGYELSSTTDCIGTDL